MTKHNKIYNFLPKHISLWLCCIHAKIQQLEWNTVHGVHACFLHLFFSSISFFYLQSANENVLCFSQNFHEVCSQSSSGQCIVANKQQSTLSLSVQVWINTPRSWVIHQKKPDGRMSPGVFSPQEQPPWSWADSRRKPYCSGILART